MASRGGRINFQVGLETDKNSFSQLKNSLKDLQNIKITDFHGTTEQLKEIQQTAAQVDKALEQAFNVNLNSVNIGEFNAQLKKSELSVDQIYSSFSKAGAKGQAAFSKMAGQVLTTNLKLKETHSVLDAMGTTMMNTVKWGIASSIMNNFTGSVRSAFNYVKSLEASLTDIRIVTGDSQEKMDQFAESANKAAQALGKSTMDYTKSALTFYQQGLSDEEVQARTEATLKAQNITGAGTEMADYLTAVWNGYKVANEQAELYVDKLAAVADSSASNMAQLATAMSKVASSANNVGVDVDSLNAQLATVIATTRAAPESVGTAFKTIYARINDIATGADEAQVSLGRYSEKMASLGFNVLDSNGKLRETQEVIEQIGNSWGDLSKEQQIYLAQTMAGQRQYNNLIALFDNWNSYTKLLNTSLESQGTLSEKNGRYMESLGAKMEQLGAAGEKVKSALINEDDLAGMIGGFSKVTNLFGTFIQSIGGGRGALLNFGSLATQLFSNTLSKQITAFITNSQNAKFNLQQIAEAERKVAEEGENSFKRGITEQYVNNLKEMQRTWSALTNEEKIAQQQNINNIRTLKEDQLVLRQNTVLAEKLFESLSGGKNLSSFKENSEFIKNQFKDFESRIRSLTQEYQNFLKIDFKLTSKQDVQQQKESLDSLHDTVARLIRSMGAEATRSDWQLLTLLKKVRNESDLTEEEIEELKTKVDNFISATQNKKINLQSYFVNKEAIEQTTKKIQEQQQNYDELKKRADLAYQTKNVLNFVRGLGQLASAFNNVINLVKIWNNENLTTGQKILQTFTNLTMTIPMLVSGLSSIVTITASEAAQDAIAAGAKTSHAVAQHGLNVALSEGTVAALGFMGAILPYVAIFAGISLAVYGLVKAWNKEADAAQHATKVAQDSKKAYEQTKQAYEDLKNSITELESMQDSMQGLVRGTQEWNDALNDVNNKVLDLIQQFPQLGSQVDAINGKLQFKQGALELLQQKQQQQTYVSGLTYAKNQQASDQATKASLIMDASREIFGASGLFDSSVLTKVVDVIEKQGIYLLHETDQLQKLAGLTDEQKKAIEANTPQLQNLILEINKNATATGVLTQSLTNSLLKDVKEYQQATNPQAFAKMVSQALMDAQLSDKYIKSGPITPGSPNSGKQIDKNAVAERYHELTGEDIKVSWGKYKVKDSSGNWTEKSKEVIEDFVALNDAMGEAGKIYSQVQEKMKKIESQFGDAADIAYNFVNGFSNIDFTTISENDLNKLRDHINELAELTGLAPEQVSKNLDSLSKSIKQGWQDFFSDVELVEPVRNAIQSLRDNNDLTLSAAETIKDSLLQAYKTGGSEAVNQLQEFYSTIEDFDAFNQVSSSFDFAKGDAEDFKEALNEAGIATNASTQAINAYIAAQKKQAEELSPEETYKNIHDIIDGFKDGSKTTLDQEEITALQQAGVNLRNYFTLVADGTMKIKEDADGFYEYANKMSIQGFLTQLDSLQQRLLYLESFSQNSYSAEQGGNWKSFSGKAGDSQQLAAQLQFLQAIGEQTAKIKELEEKVSEGRQVDQQELKYVSELLGQHKEQYLNLSDVRDRLTQQAKDYVEELQNLPQEEFKLDPDVNEEQFERLSEYLQNYADQIQGIDDSLKGNKQASDEVAESLLRYDAALAKMLEKYETWNEALTSGSLQEQIQTANELQNVYSDLLDLQPNEQLSQSFLTSAENLELFKQAAEGSTQAYDELYQRAQEDILIQMGIDTQQFYTDEQYIYDELYKLTGQKFDDIEVGAQLNDQSFLDALTRIIQNSKMTSDEAAKYLSQMGFDAQVVEVPKQTTDTVQETEFTPQVKEVKSTGHISAPQTEETQEQGLFGTITKLITKVRDFFFPQTTYGVEYDTKPKTAQNKKTTTATSLKVISAKKSVPPVGGNVKFKTASHGGGSTGTKARNTKNTNSSSSTPKKSTSRSSTPSRSSSSKKSSSTPKKNSDSKKQTKKKTKTKKEQKEQNEKEAEHIDQLKEQNDRYHDINITLQKIKVSLAQVQKEQKKLSGKDVINNLNEQLRILELQVGAYKNKIKLAKQEKTEIKKELEQKYNVSFWSTGEIIAYDTTLERQLRKVNETINYYNNLSAKQQEKYKSTVDQAKQRYEQLQKLIKQYEELMTDTIPDLQDALSDAKDSIVDLQISKFKIKIDITLDLAEATKEWNKFEKQVINKIRNDDILGNINSKLVDFSAYYGKNNTIVHLTEQVKNTMDQIAAMNSGAESRYGNNRSQAFEDLKDYTDKLMKNLTEVNELVKEIKQSYYDMINASQTAFDEQVKEYNYLESLIDHDKKLIEILYGDQAYNQMNTYFKKQEDMNKKELDFQRQQKDFWWAQMQAQKTKMASLNKESNEYKEAEDRFKKLEEHWISAVNDFNSQVEESISNLLEKYNNSISIIFNDLNKKLTNGKGLDYIGEEWELISDQADDYFDKIDSMYELQKLRKNYMDAIEDNEGNIAAQQSLNNLMEQQLKMLQDKDRLSQYDIDRANLLLQIEMKRFALEQKQQSKSKLRLRRDSQGNYSYQYTSDTEEITQAQQSLAQAQSQLYDLDKTTYRKNLNDIYNIQSNFNEKMQQLYSEYPTWTEEAQQKRKLLVEKYQKAINNLVNDNQQIRLNLMDSTFQSLAYMYDTDVDNFINMSRAEQNELINSLIPEWKSGIQEMIDTIAGKGGLIQTYEEAFTSLKQNINNYKNSLNEIQEVAQVNFNEISQGTDVNIDRVQSLIDINDKLIDKYADEVEAIQQVISQVQELTKKYKEAEQAALFATEKAYNFWQQQQVSQAQAVPNSASGSYDDNTKKTTAWWISSRDGYLEVGDDATFIGGDYWTSYVRGKIKGTQDVPIQVHVDSEAADRSDETRPNYYIVDKATKKGIGWVKKSQLTGYDTGGYTGDWGSNGKIGILHEKELVLNAKDTRNLLSAVHIVRTMDSLLSSINTNLEASNVLSSASFNHKNGISGLDQNIYITANFPNVNSKIQIQAAFNNLINRASQYIHTNNK